MHRTLRRAIRRTRIWTGRLVRRDAILRAAVDRRDRAIVVGPTFTYHFVNRPGVPVG